MKENKFDSIKELKRLNLNRLFVMQKVLLKDLEHYIVRHDLYDKNDIYKCIEELMLLNSVIKNKIELNEKKQNKCK